MKSHKHYIHNILWGVLVVLVTLTSCHKTSNGQHAEAKGKSAADSLNKPQVNIRVNRQYDDRGNMIGFDSTYTSFYSNVEGDTAHMDSLMKNFDRFFQRDHSYFFRDGFQPLFFSDSLRYPDFFHRDYFMRRYELNDPFMRNMMNRMDSIKNEFFREESQQRNKSQTNKSKSS